ncbi:MAG: DUF5317 family protein [Acidimicrobiales bacterium]
MGVIGVAVVLGLIAGRLLPPPPRHLAALAARWWLLLPAGLGLAIGAGSLDSTVALAVGMAGFAVMVTFTARNLHLAGMGVLTVGLAVNLAALVINVGMPVRPNALVAADVVDADRVDDIDVTGYRHIERPGDLAPILGDVIPLPVGRAVVSFGDLIIAVGAADVVANVTRRRRRRRRERAAAAQVDLRHWVTPDEVALASVGDPDLGIEPLWRDDIELLDVDIDLGNAPLDPRDPSDPDITIPLRQVRARLSDRAATRR